MQNLLARHLRDAPMTSCPSDPHRFITHPATALGITARGLGMDRLVNGVVRWPYLIGTGVLNAIRPASVMR